MEFSTIKRQTHAADAEVRVAPREDLAMRLDVLDPPDKTFKLQPFLLQSEFDLADDVRALSVLVHPLRGGFGGGGGGEAWHLGCPGISVLITDCQSLIERSIRGIDAVSALG